jgi:hypothetical protein
VSVKIDTREFDKTLRQYLNISKRSIEVATNTKAYYIARRAVAETPMADGDSIRRYIGHSSGRVAGMIINKRLGERGERGLYGKDMAMAVKTMLASRLRARAFIKSGWLWAVKKLAPFAESIRGPSLGKGRPKIIGNAKGTARPASSGWKCRAEIVNNVTAAWDRRSGAWDVAFPALKRAFEFERLSMISYIEKKLKSAAKSSGIKVR